MLVLWAILFSALHMCKIAQAFVHCVKGDPIFFPLSFPAFTWAGPPPSVKPYQPSCSHATSPTPEQEVWLTYPMVTQTLSQAKRAAFYPQESRKLHLCKHTNQLKMRTLDQFWICKWFWAPHFKTKRLLQFWQFEGQLLVNLTVRRNM